MASRRDFDTLDIIDEWVRGLPLSNAKTELGASSLVLRSTVLDAIPRQAVCQAVATLLDQDYQTLGWRARTHLARAEAQVSCRHGLDLVADAIEDHHGEGPFLCLTPTGPTFWCRPVFAELLSVLRSIPLANSLSLRTLPGSLLSRLLSSAASLSDSGAFHLETCLRGAETYISGLCTLEELARLSALAERSSGLWIDSCNRLIAGDPVGKLAPEFVLATQRCRSQISQAHDHFTAGEYSAAYIAMAGLMEILPNVTPVLRARLDWEAAALFSKLQHSERVGLLPQFLATLALPESWDRPSSLPVVETVYRLTSGLFGYPNDACLAMSVGATCDPLDSNTETSC